MKCPKCADLLPRLAQSCACGWSRPKSGDVDSLPWINCADENCTKPAIVRVQHGEKWLRLCETHYDRFHFKKSVASCFERELTTPEKCREWLKINKLKSFRVVT